MMPGARVRYRGDTSTDQVRWGNNDDPRLCLIPGAHYTVRRIEVHSWHTKLWLVGVEGKFNSVHFDEVPQ